MTRRDERRSRRSRSSSRSASRSSWPAPTAGSPSSRTSRSRTSGARLGERALELAIRLGDETTRAHVLVNIGSVKLDVDHRQTVASPRGARVRRRGREPTRGDACARQPRLRAHVLGAARAGFPARAAGARLRRGERGAQPRLVHRHHARLAAPAGGRVGRGRADHAGRDREEHHRAQLVAKTVLAELAVRRGDPDAAERLADLAAQAVRASEPQRIVPVLELEIEWALTRGAPMPLERLGRLLKAIPERGKPSGLGGDPCGRLGGGRRDRRRHRRAEISAVRRHVPAGLGRQRRTRSATWGGPTIEH